ncbi:GSU3529 family protein [Trichlorobacter lovleyi]|uniref:Uncharacterized protein n=1 Tax=Trichlorobacter lovleyi (strain ATCC BAA-1151 / DSM 17278 / SZ) TaxID=398767 RepID=B3E4Z3_TRIL1|nr:hypothetical protein [Trichlorobacter lovleyi]ACD94558.1 conserved hypothetical protein [Trichlorobacter lovleyi SZ]
MTVFEKLQAATEIAQDEQELPDFLVKRISLIIKNQDRYHDRNAEIEDLVDKVTNYDTYGQTGYLGMGVNNVILEKTLNRLER